MGIAPWRPPGYNEADVATSRPTSDGLPRDPYPMAGHCAASARRCCRWTRCSPRSSGRPGGRADRCPVRTHRRQRDGARGAPLGEEALPYATPMPLFLHWRRAWVERRGPSGRRLATSTWHPRCAPWRAARWARSRTAAGATGSSLVPLLTGPQGRLPREYSSRITGDAVRRARAGVGVRTTTGHRWGAGSRRGYETGEEELYDLARTPGSCTTSPPTPRMRDARAPRRDAGARGVEAPAGRPGGRVGRLAERAPPAGGEIAPVRDVPATWRPGTSLTRWRTIRDARRGDDRARSRDPPARIGRIWMRPLRALMALMTLAVVSTLPTGGTLAQSPSPSLAPSPSPLPSLPACEPMAESRLPLSGPGPLRVTEFGFVDPGLPEPRPRPSRAGSIPQRRGSTRGPPGACPGRAHRAGARARDRGHRLRRLWLDRGRRAHRALLRAGLRPGAAWSYPGETVETILSAYSGIDPARPVPGRLCGRACADRCHHPGVRGRRPAALHRPARPAPPRDPPGLHGRSAGPFRGLGGGRSSRALERRHLLRPAGDGR